MRQPQGFICFFLLNKSQFKVLMIIFLFWTDANSLIKYGLIFANCKVVLSIRGIRKMKLARISIVITLVYFVIMLASASTFASENKILVKEFTSYQEISDKQEAVIKWDFENAEFVTVSGNPTHYKPKDKIEIKASASTVIEIFAYTSSADFISLKSYIYKPGKSDYSFVRKGPTLSPYDEMQSSYLESSFLNCSISSKLAQPPYSLKIMRLKLKDPVNKDYFVHSLILDRFGNNVSGLKNSDKSIKWFADFRCLDSSEDAQITETVNNFKEINRIQTDDAIDLSIIIDNSSSAESNQEVFGYLKEFFNLLSRNDNVMLSYFNHDYENLFPLTSSYDAPNQLDASYIPPPSGMNSLYKALFKGITELKSSNKKAIILLTYMSDNSSIIYTANDAANLALSKELPIYIVGIGDAVDSYALQYITTLTGGKFYHLFNGDIAKIPEILREIAYAQKAYYEVELAIPMHFLTCSKMDMGLSVIIDGNIAKDNTDIVEKPLIQYSQYQIVAAFDENSTRLTEEYKSIIVSIAKALTDNPSAVIELIGNTGLNERDPGERIAMARAETVKNEIMAYGASPNQIKVRSEGSARPRYYLEMLEWQRKLNRRVEVRWLYSSMLPYEILAEKTETEQDAIEKTDAWEKRGQMAYYERYLDNGNIMYRIKIWGFRTLSEAQQASELLKKKYNIKPQVQ